MEGGTTPSGYKTKTLNFGWILIRNQMPRTKEIVSEAQIEDLASNIRERRRWLGMTQAELGKEIGVTQQRIAMFENGDAIPDIFQVQSISSVLNTTIEKLLNLTKEEIMSNKNTVQETMNILASMQVRDQLLESLNLRLNTSQGNALNQVQEWVGDLKEQQLSDIDLYKNNLLLSGQPRQETIDRGPEGRHESVSNEQDDWSKQFAEGFVVYLEAENSSLLDLWFGKKHSYPNYIGFDISKSGDNFNFFDSDAYWLAANLREKQVFAGIHFRNPLYFQQLEMDKFQIDFEFSQKFGMTLDWKPTTGNAGIYRISVLVGVDRNHSQNLLFEDLCKRLEKLDEIFHERLDKISQLLLPRTQGFYNR